MLPTPLLRLLPLCFLPRLTLLCLALILLAFTPLREAAADTDNGSAATPAMAVKDSATGQRPRIGLVLGGGGAKGGAHVGVLEVLESQRIPIDLVVGTSAGSAVGALYAMGYNASEIREIFSLTDWEKGFSDSTPRPDLSIRRKQDQLRYAIDIDLGWREGEFRIPEGIVQGQRLQILLNEMFMAASTVSRFDELSLPYRAVATDLETGQEVVLGEGNLAQAVRASMSVPGVYTPVVIGDRTLVDGGLANNVPISVAREMGADIVIAVDLSTPLRSARDIRDALDVMSQLSDYLTGFNSAAQVGTITGGDVLIRPQFGEIGSADFDRVAEIIDLGAQAALEQTEALSALTVTPAEYRDYRQAHRLGQPDAPVITEIELINDSVLWDQFILSRISQKTGELLDARQLEEDLGRVYGLGYFETVTYRLERTRIGHTLIINAHEKGWGPNYIRFGLNMEDNFKGESEYGLTSSLLMTGLNRFGAEWSNTVRIGSSPAFVTDFYQPLNFTGNLFLRASGEVRRYTRQIFEDDDAIADIQIKENIYQVEFGGEIDTYADIATGYQGGKIKGRVQTGPADVPEAEADIGGLYVRAYYDRLDNQFFPSAGQLITMKYDFNRDSLGSDENYDQVELQFLTAHRWQQLSFNAIVRADLRTRSGDNSISTASLGGFQNLSGFSRDQLLGRESLIGILRSFYQMGYAPNWYIGGSVEMGQVAATRESFKASDMIAAGSIFIAADTFVGPVALAYGAAETGTRSFYLNIGTTF